MTDLAERTASSWIDRYNWCLLFRTFRIATATRLLTLGAVGLLLSSLGWFVADRVFSADAPESRYTESLVHFPHHRIESPVVGYTARPVPHELRAMPEPPPFGFVWRTVIPFLQLFDPSLGWTDRCFYFSGGLWSLAVWAFVGAAMTRIGVVYLGRGEQLGLVAGIKHAAAKWRPHMAAILLPFASIWVSSIPLIAMGWLMRTNLGLVVAGLLWILVIATTFIMTILAFGLLLGWPLAWGALGSESSDSFDAISRLYAYTFQKPLEYGFLAILACVFGLLGWLVVWVASESIIQFGYWGAGWGAGSQRMEAVERSVEQLLQDPQRDTSSPGPTPEIGGTEQLGTRVLFLALWVGFVRSMATGFAISYFWCTAGAIYLLLRREVDQADLDDIFFEEESAERYGLPPLDDESLSTSTTDAGLP